MKLIDYINKNKQLNETRSELLHEIKMLKEELATKQAELESLYKNQSQTQQEINSLLTIKLGDLVKALSLDYEANPTVKAEIIFKKPVIISYFKSVKKPETGSYKIFKDKDWADAKLKITIDMNKDVFNKSTDNTVFEFIRPYNPSTYLGLGTTLENCGKHAISRTLKNGVIEYTGVELNKKINEIPVSFTIDDISKTNNTVSNNNSTINPIQKGLKYIAIKIISEYENENLASK